MKTKLFIVLLFFFIGGLIAGKSATITVGPNGQYQTIQDAYNNAADGDIIQVANGNYTFSNTLYLNKSLSIIGESETGVIINGTAITGNTSYVLSPTKSNTTLSYFTIIPNSTGGYPIHVSGTPNIISNITLSHITISGSRRTAFDLNAVDNVTLSYLTATNSSYGNGVQVSGCTNVIINHITTSGNAWGGLAVYVSKPSPSGVGRGSDNVSIDGTTSSFGEANKIYNQDEAGLFNTNITVNGFDYEIKNIDVVGYQYYQLDKAIALGFASSLPSPLKSTVKQISNSQFFVGSGMSIQTAIDAAVAGNVINVSAGTYSEMLTINKSVNLIGATGANILAPATMPPASDPLSNIITISGSSVSAEISGFVIKGPGPSNCGSLGRGIFVRDGAYANIHDNQIIDIRDNPFSGCQNGNAIQIGRLYWNTTGSATINNNVITGYQKTGIVVDNTGSSATINGNIITGTGTTSVIAQNGIQISRGATATLHGNTVTGNSYHDENNTSNWGSCGILLYQSSSVTLSGDNILSGNDQNYDASEVTGTLILGNEIFGQSAAPLTKGYYIALNTNTNVDASLCTFEGINPSSATLAQLFTIEDRIWHSVDDNTHSGFIKIKEGNVFVTNTETKAKIQNGIDAAVANDKVNIKNGTYLEKVIVNKTLTISGEDRDNVIIKGPKTAGTGQTMLLSAPGITLEKVTITRDGNNVTDWVTNANNSGLSFGQGVLNCVVQNIKVTENRNGVYINNSQGNTIKNCLLTNNRTGVQLVNNVSNTLIENNDITNNWTLGFVIYYGSELIATSNCVVKNNNITGNWYSGIDCKTVLGYNNPTISYNFANNWWGTSNLNVVTTPAGEPVYESQIPVQYGGTAVSPGGNEGKISGDLSAKIIYDPWKGKSELYNVTNADLNNDITFNASSAKANFSTMAPSTQGTLSIQRLSEPPSGTPVPPSSAGAVAPIYLSVNATGLPNFTFNCAITIDVSNIANFAAGTKVMFYSTSTNTWVGMEGTYDAVNKTYTFITNHFTLFAFVNPLNPDAVYMAMDLNNPATSQKWYPNANMNNPVVGSPDWNYTGINTSFYVVPTGTQSFFSSKFYIEWDKTKLPAFTIDAGNLFDGGFFQSRDLSSGNNGKIEVNYASANLNVVPTAGKYLAKINFTGMQPGYTAVSITGADFRYYQEDAQSNVYVTSNDGKIFFYLGDVAKAGDQTMGDGKINIEDVSLFTAAYWSTTGGANFKQKYDIGPTNANGSYWALPTSDGKIEFEDLCIFSIGYGKYAAGQLPQDIKSPLNITLESLTLGSDGYLRAPLKLSGNVSDVRALSIEINKSAGLEYAGVETQGQLQDANGFIIGKCENGKVFVDAAVIGEQDGLNKEGVIANVIFKQTGSNQNAGLYNVIARNSGNSPIGVKFNKDGGLTNGLPVTFELAQNYPNPFNPQTTINYQLPKDVFVTVKIYDMLGREVAMLVNQSQKAGYYSVVWNASQVSSGIYFYKMNAGDFSSIKKMVVLK